MRGVGDDSAGKRRCGRGEGGDDTTFLLVEVLCFALRGEGEKSDCAEAHRLHFTFSLGVHVKAAPRFSADFCRQNVIR